MAKSSSSSAAEPRLPVFWYYLITIAVSLVANWFIQLAYYLHTIDRNPLAFSGERTLADYTTGFVGDAVLLPIMNAAILFVVLHLRVRLAKRDLKWILGAGLAADILLHVSQGYLGLTNWSMPRPFQWDFVSYWHMVSFFFQISFVFMFLYVVARRMYQGQRAVFRTICLVFTLIGVFILLFLYDYGPIHRPVQEVTARLATYSRHL